MAAMAMQQERYKLLIIYRMPWFFLKSFQPIGRSGQEKIYQDGGNDGHLGFPIKTFLAIFNLHLHTSNEDFESTDFSVKEKNYKYIF